MIKIVVYFIKLIIFRLIKFECITSEQNKGSFRSFKAITEYLTIYFYVINKKGALYTCFFCRFNGSSNVEVIALRATVLFIGFYWCISTAYKFCDRIERNYRGRTTVRSRNSVSRTIAGCHRLHRRKHERGTEGWRRYMINTDDKNERG